MEARKQPPNLRGNVVFDATIIPYLDKISSKFVRSKTNLEDPGPTLDPLPLDERLNAVEGPGVRVQDDLGQGHQHQAQVN